jgi:hypothetical protein
VLGDEGTPLPEQDHSGFGNCDPGAVPLQQLHAELAFQGQDRLRQSGLAHVQLAGGRGYSEPLARDPYPG